MLTFREKNRYPYIYIDDKNQIHLMVPISAGGEIATDNTCKSTLALQQFFGATGNNSAKAVVEEYINDLENDIKTIDIYTKENPLDNDNLPAIYQIRANKLSRLEQLKKYKNLLDALSTRYNSYNLYSYPQPIRELLSKKSNFFTMALSPKKEDSVTNLDHPVFHVTRAEMMSCCSQHGLGHALRAANFLPPPHPPTATTTAANFNTSTETEESVQKKILDLAIMEFHRLQPGGLTKENFAVLLHCLSIPIAEIAKQNNWNLFKITPDVRTNAQNVLLLLINGIQIDVDKGAVNYINSDGIVNLSDENRIIELLKMTCLVDETDSGNISTDNIPDVVAFFIKTIKLTLPDQQLIPASSVFSTYIPKAPNDNDAKEKFSISIQFFLGIVNAYCYSKEMFQSSATRVNFAAIIENPAFQNQFIDIIKKSIASNQPIEKAILDFINNNYTQFRLTRPLTLEDMNHIRNKFKELFATIQDMPHFDEFLLLQDSPDVIGYEHLHNISVPLSQFISASTSDVDICSHFFNSGWLPTTLVFSNNTSSCVRLRHVNPVESSFTAVTTAPENPATDGVSDLLINKQLEQAIYQKALIKIEKHLSTNPNVPISSFTHLSGYERLQAALKILGINTANLQVTPNGYRLTVENRFIPVIRKFEAEYHRRIHITPEIAQSLYEEACDIHGSSCLDGYSNNVNIDHPKSKIKKALELLNIRYNHLTYEGNEGYLLVAYTDNFSQEVQKIRDIYVKHLPYTQIPKEKFVNLINKIGLPPNSTIYDLFHKLGIYYQNIEEQPDGSYKIVLERKQMLAFKAMMFNILREQDLEYYRSGYVHCVPEYFIFDNLTIPPDKWHQVIVNNVSYWINKRVDNEGIPIIDIQTDSAYNYTHGQGLVYRIWPTGKCRISFKNGPVYRSPRPEEATQQDIEIFLQSILAEIAKQYKRPPIFERGAFQCNTQLNTNIPRTRRMIMMRGLRQEQQQQMQAAPLVKSMPLQTCKPKVLTQAEILTHISSCPLDFPVTYFRTKMLVTSIHGYSTVRDNTAWLTNQLSSGMTEVQLLQEMAREYETGSADRRPPLVKISDLKRVTEGEKARSPMTNGAPSFTFLLEGNVAILPGLPEFNNAVFIGAGNANCIESINSRDTPTLASYASDPTQGPALQQTTPCEAAARLLFRNQGDMVKAWLETYDRAQLSPGVYTETTYTHFNYSNGYLTPKLGIANLKETLVLIQHHGDELLTNLQRVRVHGHKILPTANQNGHLYVDDDYRVMTQMVCFAINIGQIKDTGWPEGVTPSPEEKILLDQICFELLKRQYEAAACTAVLQARTTGKRVPLVLTPLGGGVFKNNPEVIRAAMSWINPIIANENVDVILSLWQNPSPQEMVKWRTIQGFSSAPALDANFDFTLKPPVTAPTANTIFTTTTTTTSTGEILIPQPASLPITYLQKPIQSVQMILALPQPPQTSLLQPQFCSTNQTPQAQTQAPAFQAQSPMPMPIQPTTHALGNIQSTLGKSAPLLPPQTLPPPIQCQSPLLTATCAHQLSPNLQSLEKTVTLPQANSSLWRSTKSLLASWVDSFIYTTDNNDYAHSCESAPITTPYNSAPVQRIFTHLTLADVENNSQARMVMQQVGGIENLNLLLSKLNQCEKLHITECGYPVISFNNNWIAYDVFSSPEPHTEKRQLRREISLTNAIALIKRERARLAAQQASGQPQHYPALQ